jgi:hypothetical protein
MAQGNLYILQNVLNLIRKLFSKCLFNLILFSSCCSRFTITFKGTKINLAVDATRDKYLLQKRDVLIGKVYTFEFYGIFMRFLRLLT